MAFIQEPWPRIYDQTYKFLNALDYMNLRLTGRFVATVDSILTSWVTDNRNPHNIRYDPQLVAQSGIAIEKLPDIVSLYRGARAIVSFSRPCPGSLARNAGGSRCRR